MKHFRQKIIDWPEPGIIFVSSKWQRSCQQRARPPHGLLCLWLSGDLHVTFALSTLSKASLCHVIPVLALEIHAAKNRVKVKSSVFCLFEAWKIIGGEQ